MLGEFVAAILTVTWEANVATPPGVLGCLYTIIVFIMLPLVPFPLLCVLKERLSTWLCARVYSRPKTYNTVGARGIQFAL